MILLANQVVQQGRPTTILLANDSGELLKDIHKDVKVINLSKDRIIFCLFPLIGLLRKSERPVELATTMYHCNILACILKLFVPSLRVTIRESTSIDFYKAHFGSVKYLLFKILSGFFYPLADRVIFPSRAMMERFKSSTSLFQGRVFIAENPINKFLIDQLKVESISEEEWIPKHRNVIINVGRVDKNKNQILILNALAKVSTDFDWQFILVGDGPELQNLKHETLRLGLQERVFFAGFQQNPFKYLYRSHIFILSSKYEGFPNVLLQAKHLKLNIISTDCPTGPKEILEDYKNGVLIPLDSEELKKKLESMMKRE